jgi:hypothetical protein
MISIKNYKKKLISLLKLTHWKWLQSLDRLRTRPSLLDSALCVAAPRSPGTGGKDLVFAGDMEARVDLRILEYLF